MASSRLALAVSLAGLATADATGTAVTPVQKVVELMNGMLTTGKSAKHDEQVQFANYKQFCDDTSAEKQRSIREADERIAVLKADIEKYAADSARLTKEIAGHDADVAVWTGDQKAATKVRSLEKADYDALHADYSESIDAVQRAIVVMRKQEHSREQAADSFVQVAALKQLSLMPIDTKRAIDAFLQGEPVEGLAVSAPEAYGYEFQSQGIVEMLNKLEDKFTAQRTAIEKEEMNTKHAFDMLMQDLTSQIAQASQDREEKSMTKAKKLEAKAGAEGDHKETTDTRAADQTYLDDLSATCDQKSSEFEARQQLRAEEIEAIEKAIEIISSSAVSGNADTYLPSFVQKKATALVSLRTSMDSTNKMRVAMFLRDQAKRQNSRILSTIAARVSDDPFQKVKKMIKDLMVRLMEEANDEAEHKGWCDTELATNEATRKEKTESVEQLHAESDEHEASIAKLTEDIGVLSQAVADLDAAMTKATKLRETEKAKNAQTVADSQAAQTAVAQATTVLKEFYGRAGEATALLQQQPTAPEIFSKPYTGMQSENGGVLGMLEVIESDFARLEAETKAAEESAQKEYDTFMTDSKVDKEAKSTDVEQKTGKREDETQALAEKRKDLEGTQQELDAALAYFDKLKPSCVNAGVSYDDRVARRKEEIESLQEALKILNGEDIA